HGWLFRGQEQPVTAEMRGGSTAGLAPRQFVYCISNHDQTGNRALGERLNHVITPAAHRAASALLCLVPQTPLLFMGQEWAASTPFQFFTDHHGKLGEAITQGRRREFQSFTAFRDPEMQEKIPDPQAPETFERSKLNWHELDKPEHSGTLLLHMEFLQLRRTHPAFRERTPETYLTLELDDGIVAILYGRPGEYTLAVVSDLVGGHEPPIMDDARLSPGEGRDWIALLSSNEPRFGGNDVRPFSIPTTM